MPQTKLPDFGVGPINVTDYKSPTFQVADRPTIAGLGSTAGKNGGWLPSTPKELEAVERALDNPTRAYPVPITLQDSRWPAKDGWKKYGLTVQDGSGNEIHYVYNERTHQMDDFKIVPPEHFAPKVSPGRRRSK